MKADDGILIGVLIVVVVILATMWIREAPRERAYQEQFDACVKYAKEHVWPDGRTVADDVLPEAWCQP